MVEGPTMRPGMPERTAPPPPVANHCCRPLVNGMSHENAEAEAFGIASWGGINGDQLAGLMWNIATPMNRATAASLMQTMIELNRALLLAPVASRMPSTKITPTA